MENNLNSTLLQEQIWTLTITNSFNKHLLKAYNEPGSIAVSVEDDRE